MPTQCQPCVLFSYLLLRRGWPCRRLLPALVEVGVALPLVGLGTLCVPACGSKHSSHRSG